MDFHRFVQHARAHAKSRSRAAGRRLAAGQQPTTMFITCADSRIVTSAITGAEPGTLFELRTAGNVIPPYSLTAPSSEMATIEFAVLQLGVSELVVCGHSHCGAVAGLKARDLRSKCDDLTGRIDPEHVWQLNRRGITAGSDRTVERAVDRHGTHFDQNLAGPDARYRQMFQAEHVRSTKLP